MKQNLVKKLADQASSWQVGAIHFAGVVVVMNALVFTPLLIGGRVPVAFDYGVASYQPWRVDYERGVEEPLKRAGHDDIRIFYPQRRFITETLKSGKLPFWNPHEFSGNVSLANSQTAVFYAPFWLFLVMPQVAAWSLLVFLTPVVTGLGMFLWTRRLLGNSIAAMVAGLAWAFCEVMVTRCQDGLVAGQALIWLPWALWGAEMVLQNKKLSGVMVMVTALSLSILAGWFQFSFYVLMVIVGYSMFVYWRDKKLNGMLMIWGAVGLAMGVTAVHWMPAMKALSHTPRGLMGTPEEFITKHLMPVWQLATVLVPRWFGHAANDTYFGMSEYKEGVMSLGVIPMALAVVGLVHKKSRREGVFWILLAGLGVVLGTQNPVAIALMKADVPILGTFLPNRWLTLTAFGLSVLAGYGTKLVVKQGTDRLRRVVVGILGVMGGFYGVVALLYGYEKFADQLVGWSWFERGIERYVQIAVKESFLSFGLMVIAWLVLVTNGRKQRVIFLIIGLMMFEQVVRATGYEYFSAKESEFPKNPLFEFLSENTKNDPARFLSISYSRLSSNTPTYFGLYSPEGVDALYPIWYGQFTGHFDGVGAYKNEVRRIEASFAEALERRGWIDPMTINLLAHLGVRYVIVPKDHGDLPPEPYYRRVFAYQWHVIYEVVNYWPKAYFVSRHAVSDWPDLTLSRMMEPLYFGQAVPEVIIAGKMEEVDEPWRNLGRELEDNFDLKLQRYLRKEDVDTMAVVERFRKRMSENPVEVVSYDVNEMELRVDASRDGWVVINDTFFPGWRADVNGEEMRVYRANQTFRAVPVKEGEQIIRMEFVPEGFEAGKKITGWSLVTTGVWGGVMVIGQKRRRR